MKILILSSPAGNGHNSTAKRIKEKFLNEDPSHQIEIIDIYKSYNSKLNAWIFEKGYFLACNHFVSLYNYGFSLSEKNTYQTRLTCSANKDVYPMLHGILNKIYDFKPDLIIATYIYCAVALANLKRVFNIPAKIACMTLDYGVSPYWECASDVLDYMFITDDYMIKPFKERGYNDNQLIVSGIPVSEQFQYCENKSKAKENLGLNPDLFTVIVMKSGFFPINEKSLIKHFKNIKQKIQLVIVNGRSEKSQKLIDKYIKKYKLHHDVHNLGFKNNIPEYFNASDLVLGKAGGLTTTETLCSALPSLIVDKLPKQEIYNRDYMINNGCAMGVTKKSLSDTLNKVLENKQAYNDMLQNCLKVRKLGAIEKMYNVLKNIPVANYDSIEPLTLTKRQLIKRVNKQRKLLIKNEKLNKKKNQLKQRLK